MMSGSLTQYLGERKTWKKELLPRFKPRSVDRSVSERGGRQEPVAARPGEAGGEEACPCSLPQMAQVHSEGLRACRSFQVGLSVRPSDRQTGPAGPGEHHSGALAPGWPVSSRPPGPTGGEAGRRAGPGAAPAGGLAPGLRPETGQGRPEGPRGERLRCRGWVR